MALAAQKIATFYGGFVHVWAPCPETMGDYRITVLPGDGTGREVALEAQKILDTIAANTNHGFDLSLIHI